MVLEDSERCPRAGSPACPDPLPHNRAMAQAVLHDMRPWRHSDVQFQRDSIAALRNIVMHEVDSKQGVVDSGLTIVLAAIMDDHAADAELQRRGCELLACLPKQAVVDAGGLKAVVAAIYQHAGDAKLPRLCCDMLRSIYDDGSGACKQAVVNADGPAAVVAA